ncbi:rod-binding protein [Microbulbifer sp. ARAS458-1]|uniref:rod-binding protein n=1 Tax=Microbulbifer sp. ARAS458-1 TaxID=3140242 RepID=UPI003877A211
MSPTDTRAGLALDVQGLNRLKLNSDVPRGDKNASLQAAAEQFEALFLHQVMKSMREATPRSGLMNSSATRFYESMFDQQLSSHLSGRGLGLAEQLVSQLSRAAESEAAPATRPQASDLQADEAVSK